MCMHSIMRLLFLIALIFGVVSGSKKFSGDRVLLENVLAEQLVVHEETMRMYGSFWDQYRQFATTLGAMTPNKREPLEARFAHWLMVVVVQRLQALSRQTNLLRNMDELALTTTRGDGRSITERIFACGQLLKRTRLFFLLMEKYVSEMGELVSRFEHDSSITPKLKHSEIYKHVVVDFLSVLREQFKTISNTKKQLEEWATRFSWANQKMMAEELERHPEIRDEVDNLLLSLQSARNFETVEATLAEAEARMQRKKSQAQTMSVEQSVTMQATTEEVNHSASLQAQTEHVEQSVTLQAQTEHVDQSVALKIISTEDV